MVFGGQVERWLNQFDSELDGRFLSEFEQVMACVEAKGRE
jgi:hypothetical protein